VATRRAAGISAWSTGWPCGLYANQPSCARPRGRHA